MSLREYQRKRHFQRTPEPGPKTAPPGGHSFVVQKHHASHRHYDFRLELDGVFKSWAVPKGPSLDPAIKRLAMQVEDHPVDYGSFEGIIPAGEYGGGTVMLWDRGEWAPVGDAHEGYRSGRFKFQLHGEKLRGGWMLVRKSKPAQDDTGKREWLLFKERDDEARPADEGDVLEELPLSVATGRSVEEIAADRDAVWGAEPKADGARKARSSRSRSRANSATAKVARRGTRRTAATAPPLKTTNYDADAEEFAGVRLTSPDKVLYPEQGITKLELATYYEQVADWMLPHLVERPLVLVRCPEGRQKTCFYQKHPAVGTPENLRRIPIREAKKTEEYVVVDDVGGLISLAQIGALEIHAWGSRADKLERPDRLIFDLDPDVAVPWGAVVQSARQVRLFLQELGLESFVKTTGGKGLHLVAPIDRRQDWEEVKTFCKRVADLIVKADPGHYTANMAKAARGGKIFIDYLRNARGATAILPYSPRARPGAAVSTPLAWEELSPRVRSDHYTIRNIPTRLAALKRDPWEDMKLLRQALRGPMEKLRALM
jgi:bifunctional non-homologous end joining protein LigD